MKVSLLSLLSIFILPSAQADVSLSSSQQKLLAELQLLRGKYKLVEQEQANPCHFLIGSEDGGREVFLNLRVVEAADEFHKVGDIELALQQNYEGKSISLFDRASFNAINLGTRRFPILQAGMLISHESKYASDGKVLSHTVTITGLTGGEQSEQLVDFNDDGSGFHYKYTIYSRNALGFTRETTPAGSCWFERIE